MAVSILSNSSPVHSSSIQFSESCTSTSKTPIDESDLVENDEKNNEITRIPDDDEEIKDKKAKDESKDSKTAHKSASPTSSERKLRKRKINLNALSSNLTCPKVCQFSNCGIQLPNSDALDWHYEGHFSQELEKLDKLKVKKPNNPSTNSSDSLLVRRPLRNSVVDRIRFNREKRLVRKSLLR